MEWWAWLLIAVFAVPVVWVVATTVGATWILNKFLDLIFGDQ